MNNIFQEKIQKIMVLFVMVLGFSCVSFGVFATKDLEQEVSDLEKKEQEVTDEISTYTASSNKASQELDDLKSFERGVNAGIAAMKVARGTGLLQSARQQEIYAIKALMTKPGAETKGRDAVVERLQSISQYTFESTRRSTVAEESKRDVKEKLNKYNGDLNTSLAGKIERENKLKEIQQRLQAKRTELQQVRSLVRSGPKVEDVIRVPGVPAAPKLERSGSQNPIVPGAPRISPSSTGTKPGKGRTQDIEKEKDEE